MLAGTLNSLAAAANCACSPDAGAAGAAGDAVAYVAPLTAVLSAAATVTAATAARSGVRGLGIRDRSVNGLSPNFTVRPDRIGSMVNVSAGTGREARGAGGGASVFTRFPERSGPAPRAEGVGRGA